MSSKSDCWETAQAGGCWRQLITFAELGMMLIKARGLMGNRNSSMERSMIWQDASDFILPIARATRLRLPSYGYLYNDGSHSA